jgi:hypothetical protein
MSALGQKQTFALQNVMSALPRKRTLIAGSGMSILCQLLSAAEYYGNVI